MDITLAAFVGEWVTIRYDPRDLAEIRVYHNDQFLCKAVCQELASYTISLKEITRARRKRKKELRKIINEKKTLLDVVLESSDLCHLLTFVSSSSEITTWIAIGAF